MLNDVVVKCTFDCTFNDGVYVIELDRSICRDMMMMVWHDMIDVLGVGMLDNCSSGIRSTNIR